MASGRAGKKRQPVIINIDDEPKERERSASSVRAAEPELKEKAAEPERKELPHDEAAPLLSPKLEPEKYHAPLDRLHDPLMELSSAIEGFNKSLAAARKVAEKYVAPAWVPAWARSEKHPEQDALQALLHIIDPDIELADQLEYCREAISSFDKSVHQKLIQFFAGEDKKNVAEINALLIRVFNPKRGKLEEDKKKYNEIKSTIVESRFRDEIRAAKQGLQWITTDIANIERWNASAAEFDTRLGEMLKDKAFQGDGEKLDLPKELSPNAAKDIFIDKSDSTVFTAFQQESLSLIDVMAELVEQKVDEGQVKAKHDELERLSDIYNKAKNKYRIFLKTLADLQGSYVELDGKVDNDLREFEREENTNQDDMLSLLGDYLNNPGAVDNANIGLQIDTYLQARTDVTARYKGILEDHLENAKQTLTGLQDVKMDAEEIDKGFDELVLPSFNRMVLDSRSSPGWQDKKLDRYKAKLGIETVQSVEQSFKKQLEQLKEKERNLVAMQVRLQERQQGEQKEIGALARLLLMDLHACSPDDREAYFEGHVKAIEDKIKNLRSLAERCLEIKQSIDQKLKELESVADFATDASAPTMQAAKSQIAELKTTLNKLVKEGQQEADQKALQELQSIRKYWQDQKEMLPKPGTVLKLDYLPPRLTVTQEEFYEKMKDFLTPLLFEQKEFDVPDAAGDVYKATVVSYVRLIEERRIVLQILLEIAPELFPKKTGVTEGKLFKEIEFYIISSLAESKKAKLAQILTHYTGEFAQLITNTGWEDKEPDSYDNEARQNDAAFLKQLEHQFEKHQSYADMAKNLYYVEQLVNKKEKLTVYLQQLAEANAACVVLKQNIRTLLERLYVYKNRSLYFNHLEPQLAEKRRQLNVLTDAVKRAKELSESSLLFINDIDQAVREINEDRSKLFGKLNSNINQLKSDFGSSAMIDVLGKALKKIESEESFKNNILSLYQNITAVKQRQAAISPNNGELFKRMRREFLFSGKSRDLIAKLRAHRLQHHGQTGKTSLIDNFLQGLFDESKTFNLQALQDYL